MWVWRHRYEELGARDGRAIRAHLREPRGRGGRDPASPPRPDLRLPVPAAGARRSSSPPTRAWGAARRVRCCGRELEDGRRVVLRERARRRVHPLRGALAVRSARRRCASTAPSLLDCEAERAAPARRGAADAHARLRRLVRQALPVRDGRPPGTHRRRRATGICTSSSTRRCARADKLKYPAGSEQGAGTFIADTLPEESAAGLARGDRLCRMSAPRVRSRSREPDRGAHRLQPGARAAVRDRRGSRRARWTATDRRCSASSPTRARPRRAGRVRARRAGRRAGLARVRARRRRRAAPRRRSRWWALVSRSAAISRRAQASPPRRRSRSRCASPCWPSAASPTSTASRSPGCARVWRTSGSGAHTGLLDQLASLYGAAGHGVAHRLPAHSQIEPVPLRAGKLAGGW